MLNLRGKDISLDRQGFTVVEMAIVLLVFGIIFLGIMAVMADSFAMFTLGEDLVALQEQSRKAIDIMWREVREAGVQTNPAGPDDYPTVTGGGSGIQFILPSDLDGDGFFTKGPPASALFAIGDVEWDLANIISYGVEAAPNGEGRLVRRVNGANPQVIGRYFQNVQFDDFDTDPVNIALGEVRVQMTLGKNTTNQNALTHTASFSVRMRN